MPDLQIVTDLEFLELSKDSADSNSCRIGFNDDPIVLACASYRFWREGGHRWAALESVVPTAQDRQQAELVRSYYRARITFERLRSNSEQPVSEFRRKLIGIIDGYYEITYKDLGILYRLPYFYQEDTAHDSIVETFPRTHNKFDGSLATFELYKKVLISRQRFETVQLWLQTSEYDAATCIAVRADNPLLPLLEGILAQGPVTFVADWQFKRLYGYRYGYDYYQLANMKLKGVC